MKIATKIFISAAFILAIAFNIGSSMFIKDNFDHSIKMYTEISINEYYTQKYIFKTQVNSDILQGVSINERYLENLAFDMIDKGLWHDKYNQIKLSDVEVFTTDTKISRDLIIRKPDDIVSSVIENDNKNILIISSLIITDFDIITFTQGVDITHVFMERNRQLSSMFFISIFIISISSLLLFIISKFLTSNIKKLTKATNEMTNGCYDNEIIIKGNDEITILFNDFNTMIKSIKDNIQQLDNNIKNREDFVTNFSHELKTPMTAIIGYSELLLRNNWADEKVTEAATYIFSEGKRLELLSKKMLDLMQLDNENIIMTPNNLISIITKSVDSTSVLIKDNICNINVECDELIVVQCHNQMIIALLINLIENGLKACDYCKDIDIKVKDEDNHIKISVIDKGHGIDDEHITLITQPFYMVDRSRKGNSTGIGLTFASKIAQLHNTDLNFESKIDHGTCVSFRLEKYYE